MIKLTKGQVYLKDGKLYSEVEAVALGANIAEAHKGTIANSILTAHNVGGDDKKLKLKFDALASHDITYVGIIQTAKGSGLTSFPIPYVLTNCHNSLCAVGGTINEDDHLFGLSAAKKYGGIFVPPHLAVIHTYMREMMSGAGRMILGSDSHTRYGALGTMAVGEGGPELVKQLLSRTYDIAYPEVIAVVLKNKLRHGVGPQDVALTLIGEVFKSGFVKNKVLEFVGEGVHGLSMEERNGIDVMTTETACLSSVWVTDEKTQAYFVERGRADAYKKLEPKAFACYDGAVEIDLSKVEPMIALPFHPSNTYTLKTLLENTRDIFAECEKQAKELRGKNAPALDLSSSIKSNGVHVCQGVIAGCAGGTYDNIVRAGNILKGKSIGCGDFTLSVYPSSQPVYAELVKNGTILNLMQAGA
ncbi:MAG: hydratase, partial [Clostridia bacterium]|nr:hydratase [Clostridia bacterium]